LLNKDPQKRISLKELLESNWIKKFTKSNVIDKRKNVLGKQEEFLFYSTTNENKENK
jgi:hypothetical protein